MPNLLIGRLLGQVVCPRNDQGSHVCRNLSVADRGLLRRAWRVAEPWIEVRIVSVANIVGLALSVLIALLLVAALIYPERF
jgi:hypothetical protein